VAGRCGGDQAGGLKRLVGSAPELIRHYIELRGIGVVDVQQLFGMSAVREDQDIDLWSI
jgi:HPr kinase/phosphorylase